MLTAARLKEMAERKLEDAILLVENGRWGNGYYLLGYVVELALKAVIARRFKGDEIPDLKLVTRVYTHDLGALVRLADLSEALAQRERQTAAFAENWSIVANWSEASRYVDCGELQARTMLSAVSDPEDGIFPWLKQHW